LKSGKCDEKLRSADCKDGTSQGPVDITHGWLHWVERSRWTQAPFRHTASKVTSISPGARSERLLNHLSFTNQAICILHLVPCHHPFLRDDFMSLRLSEISFCGRERQYSNKSSLGLNTFFFDIVT
jgi:hypothetical protein